MLGSRVANLLNTTGRRAFATASRPLASAAAPPAETKTEGAVDPSDPIIAPTTIAWREYKNEHYRKRGYKLADKSWTEWSDLPAPYKYLGVKVNPEHVESHGPLWKAMSDWKLAVPLTLLVAMPLWMTGNFPSFNEQLELSLITILAGTVISKEVAPLYKNWKKGLVEPKIKALYEAEAGLNNEISHAIDVFKAGQAIPETMKKVHAAERALRKLEAVAATNKTQIAQRDMLVAELDFLVSLRSTAAGETESGVVKAARDAVEVALQKDNALQQKTIDAAIKALQTGVDESESILKATFDSAVEKARKDASKQTTSNPFTVTQQIDIFNKRFGFVHAGNTRKIQNTDVVLKSPLSYVK